MNEQEKNIKEKNKQVAQKLAETKGFESFNDLTQKAKELLNSSDAVERSIGKAIAQGEVDSLSKLILRQEIIDAPTGDYMDIVEKIFDGWMYEGNTKEYLVDLDTGSSTYDVNEFNPKKQTLNQIESWKIQIYNDAEDGKHLSPQGYQFKKQLTLPVNEWLPFFKNGTLNDYIAKKQLKLNRTFKKFIFNKFATLVSDKTKGKIVNGTATNLFDAILELAPLIDDMQLENSTYNNEQTSKNIYAADKKDIYIFCSTKVRSMIMNGIKTQLFNTSFVGAENKSFNYENLKLLGNKIIVGDEDSIIKISDEPYVDDSTIIVIDLSRVKNIVQVDEIATQDYANNLTRYEVKHTWGAMDVLPWCKKIVYKNINLLTMPGTSK